jgi:adenosylcobinamide-GDP ribazoletransferase
LAAALILVAWAALTGMLHLDGWADCCDALVAPLSRERRLEVMKDPRLGSFGGAGLVLLLLVKLAAVAEVLTTAVGRPPAALLPLLVVPVLGRWAIVIAAAAFPLARPDGMGASFRRGLGRREVILATLTAAATCLVIGWVGLALWAAAGLALLGMARLATSRLGGLTGDVYGAIIELTETVTLVTVVLFA